MVCLCKQWWGHKVGQRRERNQSEVGGAQAEGLMGATGRNTHLSPHHRHLPLEHGFVEAFIRL